jgi:hypothetical protein
VAIKDYIERLKMVVEQLHNCAATHVRSTYVTEIFHGRIAWEGYVETFLLIGHPEAKRCYGWTYGELEQFITILELPPVDSAESAVKAGVGVSD